MSGISVEIVGLSKQYGSMIAVDNVSLHVDPGEFIALLGPSGSGKSTLLMSIAGFVEPSSGYIRIGNNDVTRLPPRRRNIGMVFQKYALFPHMTVAENIEFPLLQKRVPRAEIASRLEWVTDLVGLRGLQGRPVPLLSGGQQQRVALARALVFKPPVLLMDEPLGALDKKLREHLQVEIKQIQKVTGTTVIFVTHDQTEALGMADRVVVFNKGRIEQLGTPNDLYERPKSAFVADFIGDTNILQGTIRNVASLQCEMELRGGSMVDGTLIGDSLAAGDTADLLVRPRSVVTGPARDGLRGTVVSRSYFGDSVNLRVQLVGGDTVTVKEQPSSPWEVGHEVSIGWQCQDAKIFKHK